MQPIRAVWVKLCENRQQALRPFVSVGRDSQDVVVPISLAIALAVETMCSRAPKGYFVTLPRSGLVPTVRAGFGCGPESLNWSAILLRWDPRSETRVETRIVNVANRRREACGRGRLWQMAPQSVDATITVGQKPGVEVREQTLGAAPGAIVVPPVQREHLFVSGAVSV